MKNDTTNQNPKKRKPIKKIDEKSLEFVYKKELEEAKTALEKANLELEESLKIGIHQFNLFADNIPGNIYIKDEKLEYIFLNLSASKEFNLQKENINGLTVHDLFPKNIAKKFRKVDLEVQQKKKIIEKEIKISVDTSNEKWVRIIKFPIQMPEGKIFVGGIVLDITQEKQKSIEVINSELRYRALFESARDGIFIIDLGKIIDVNKSSLLQFGCQDKSEMINKSVMDFSPEYQPDGSLSKDSAITVIKKAMTGKPQSFNWVHKRKDGTEFLAEISLNQFPYKNKNYVAGSIRDITKKVAVQQELLKAKETAEISEKYLDNVINNIGDPVFVKDEKSRLLLVNDAACAIFSLPREKIIGRTLGDEVTPDEREVFLRIDRQVLKTGQEKIIEETLTLRGGQTKTISTRKTRFVDSNGKKYLIGVIRDITDRKKAEEKIKESEEKLRAILDHHYQMTGLLDKEGRILAANQTVLEFIGKKEKELIGNFFWNNPRWKSSQRTMIKSAIENAAKGQFLRFETKHINNLGEVRNFDFSLNPVFDDNGKVIYLVPEARDITERKIIEEQLKKTRTKFEILSDVTFEGIAIHDKGFSIDINNSLSKMFGYRKNELLNKNGIELLIRSDYHKIVYKHIENNYQLPYEVIGIKKDGTEIPVEIEGKTYSGEDNIILRVTALRDITERKKTKEKLEQANLELIEAVGALHELKKQLEDQNVYLKKELDLVFNFEEMVYGSAAFSDVLTELEKVAPTDATVLLLGESGTGKELLARALHNLSLKNKKPFIKVNCSAIPSELIESELFGHKKGSFTGAVSNKVGKFELADGGTLFLDEIGDLPLAMQPKLLRFLQEGEMEVVGGVETRKLDVRIVAATNKDIKEEVNKSQFREDLYFRLNVFPIEVPALRKRKEDIPLLVEHFVNKFRKKYRKNIKYVADSAMQDMRAYDWPGNIRELENLVERSVILSDSETLSLPGFGSEESKKSRITSGANLTLNEVQKNHILSVLEKTNWKVDGPDGAAIILDIKPSTFRDKMKKLGIERPD